jgi:arylsulfatase A-like enzyme
MKRIILSIALAVLVFAGCSQDQKPKPNVLFILADDLGYHDLSVMGSKYYETPNIDRIASEAMVFSNGYAACQVCSPSRGSIMTGKFPARHGITDWIGAPSGEEWRKYNRFTKLLPPEYEHQLADQFVTLPEAMKEAGYKTFFAGKWHLGGKGSWPQDHGFDINKGGWDVGSPKGGYFDPYDNPNLENRQPGENLSLRLADETVKFLNENNPQRTGKPVFAFLSFYAVHGPIQTTPEKWRKYRDKAYEMGVAESGFKMGPVLPARVIQDNPVYGGLVEAMDDAVGLVLKSLEELGLDENTIVVFTSDNGGVVSGDAYATSNLPLRGGKGHQYEGGIREPYFIKVPGKTEGGEECDVPVSGADFYPTILELTGQSLQPGEHNDGVSLVPLLKGGEIEERSLIWHYPHYGNQGGAPSSIIRRGDWKLIHYYEDDRDELFNLVKDVRESNNLITEYPEKASKLKNELMTYLKDVGANFPERDPLYDEAKEKAWLQRMKEKRLPQLERQRMEFLSGDYDPGNEWWGSAVND